MSDILLGASLLLAWQLLGLGVISLLRSELREETWWALVNVITWPAGLAFYPTYRFRRWKRERDRQAHLTEQVRAGYLTPERARDSFKWRGGRP